MCCSGADAVSRPEGVFAPAGLNSSRFLLEVSLVAGRSVYAAFADGFVVSLLAMMVEGVLRAIARARDAPVAIQNNVRPVWKSAWGCAASGWLRRQCLLATALQAENAAQAFCRPKLNRLRTHLTKRPRGDRPRSRHCKHSETSHPGRCCRRA
jgi:hypothetical protein